MKKLLLSAAVLGTFFLYALHEQLEAKEHAEVVAIKSPNVTDTPLPTLSATPVAVGPTPTPIPRGRYKDGTFTGPVTDALYGPMQVKVVIQNGKISDVLFLQFPNDRRTSVEINQQAMPLLKQEAIRAQSAKVDGVSGATQSSDAFIQSLDAALKQAT